MIVSLVHWVLRRLVELGFRSSGAKDRTGLFIGLIVVGMILPGSAVAHAKRFARCGASRATIVGTPGPDNLVGTQGRDVIAGLGGNDVIRGLAGNDLICGGPGDDRILGGPSADTLVGGPGNDLLDGGGGRDTAFYGDSPGSVDVDLSQSPGGSSGAAGADKLRNVEQLTGSAYGDTLIGSTGPNRIRGLMGNDVLLGGAGNDDLSGGRGADFVAGEAGANRIDGGAGVDTCSGNSGSASLSRCETVVVRAQTAPAGSPLPTDAEAAALVRRSSWEPRPGNVAANATMPNAPLPWSTQKGQLYWKRWIALRNRVTGRFTGTTDEIIQWAAYKWGIDEDVVRAIAVQESHWYQSSVGDNGGSFGLLQVKDHYADGTIAFGGYPWTQRSTALSVDFALARIRACYEGAFYDGGSWLYGGQTVQRIAAVNGWDYVFWGCVGSWFSGGWYDSGAQSYVAEVKAILAERPWRSWR